VSGLKIIVHYPKRQEDIAILEKKVATVHAEAVVKYIEKIQCPKEQKISLLNAIKKDLQPK